MKQFKIKVTDEIGLHARPATMIVNEAAKYVSKLEIGLEGKELINLKSIMGVMSLGARQDSVLVVQVEGPDEDEAAESVLNIFKTENIGEEV